MLVLVAGLVYFPALGSGGFHSTEGHRAIPAYEILDSGEWLLTTMFGEPYLRKPPGMPWAIAVSSMVFGETALAARLVSAVSITLMSVVAFGYARRWFGARAGLISGLSVLLMPWLWEVGRAAEIEALNTLGVQLAVLAVVDVALGARGRRRAVSGVLLGIGLALLLFAKGPAGVAPVAAALAVSVLIGRSPRVVVRPSLFVPVLVACGLFGAYVLAVGAKVEAAGGAVTQSPGAFRWTEPWWVVATLPIAAFVASLPASLGLLFPWGPDARAESARSGAAADRYAIVRALALSWVVSVVALAAVGIGNVRYTMPSAVVLGPVVGWVFTGVGAWLVPKRDVIARGLLLWRPAAWLVLLGVAAGLYIAGPEARRRATSGEAAGVRLAGALAEARVDDGGDGVIDVIADGVVEARPETLLAMARSWDGERPIRVRWRPGLTVGGLAENGDVFVVRLDDREAGLIEGGAFVEVYRQVVHKYDIGAFVPVIGRELDQPE